MNPDGISQTIVYGVEIDIGLETTAPKSGIMA